MQPEGGGDSFIKRTGVLMVFTGKKVVLVSPKGV